MSYSDASDQRRQRLMAALLGKAPSVATGAHPLFGGAGRGFAGGVDLPAAALPALTFNPFFAQQNHGVPGLAPPTRATQPPSQGNDNYSGVDPNTTYFGPSTGAPVTAGQEPQGGFNGNSSSIDLSGGASPRRLFGGGGSYDSGAALYSLLNPYQQPQWSTSRMA